MTYCFQPVRNPEDSPAEMRLQYLSGLYMTLNQVDPGETYNLAFQNSSLIAWVDTEDEAFLHSLVAKATPEGYNTSKYFVGEFNIEIEGVTYPLDREHEEAVNALLEEHGHKCLAEAFYDPQVTVRVKNLRRVTT